MPTVTDNFIKSLKTSQLVEIYNGLANKNIKKFVDRATGETRVKELLIANDGGTRNRAEILTYISSKGIHLAFQPDQVKIQETPIERPKSAPVQALKSAINKAIASGAPFLVNEPAIEVITDKLDSKALNTINGKAKKATKEPSPATPAPSPKKKAAPVAPKQEEAAAPRKQNTPPHLNIRCPECGYYAKGTPAMLAKARLMCPVNKSHGMLLTAEERNEKRGR